MTKINGYKINRGRGCVGYVGTSFSPTWAGHDDAPFIAFIDPSTIPSTECELVAACVSPNATTIHLGYYNDSRKAAYVVAMYNANPSAVIRQWLDNNKQIDVDFPDELFSLTEYLTLDDAQRLIDGRAIKSSVPKTRRNSPALTKARTKLVKAQAKAEERARALQAHARQHEQDRSVLLNQLQTTAKVLSAKLPQDRQILILSVLDKKFGEVTDWVSGRDLVYRLVAVAKQA